MKRRAKAILSAGPWAGLAAVLAAVVFLSVRGPAGAEDQVQSVSAAIDQDCQSRPGVFTVAPGQHASEFARVEFQEGTACDGSGPPENRGFAIYNENGGPVYMWSSYREQAAYERGGPLEELVLQAGTYTLSVAGGSGARVKLSFRAR